MTAQQRAEEVFRRWVAVCFCKECRKLGKSINVELLNAMAKALDQSRQEGFEEGKIHGKKLAEYVEKYNESDEHVEECCKESRQEGVEAGRREGFKAGYDMASEHWNKQMKDVAEANFNAAIARCALIVLAQLGMGKTLEDAYNIIVKQSAT